MKRFEKTGSDGIRNCSGRPRLSTKRQDRFLERKGLQDRFRTATRLQEDLEEIGMKAGTSTVRLRFRAANLMGRIALKKPMLTPSHRLRRLCFPKMYKYWTKEDWEKVLRTNEPHLVLLGNVTKMYVRRRVGAELSPQCVTSTVKHGGRKIQV